MIDIVDTVKNTLLLLLTIVIIILMVDRCTSISDIVIGEPEVIARDSTGVNFHKEKTKVDTFIIVSPPKRIPVYIHDTLFLDTLEIIPMGLDTFYAPVKDSLLDATITVISETRPFIKFDYKLKSFNTTTEITDSTFSQITEKVRVNQLYYGVEAIVYPGFKGIFFGVDLVSKKGWQVEGSIGAAQFDTGTDPMIKVGFKKLITFRRKKK